MRLPDPWMALAPVLGLCGCGPGQARAAETPWFTEVTRERGLDYVHANGAQGHSAMPEIMGGGVALLDADGDGDLDLYCVGGNGGLPQARPAAGYSRFYRQDAGGRFVEDTAAAGLDCPHYGMGAAVADVDDDGDEDLLVTAYGPNTLFVNGGGGHFRATGGVGDGWSCSAAFFDLDRDGLLELFVTRYVSFDPAKACHDDAGRPEYCGPKVFPPQHDLLFANAAGTLRDATHAAGVDALAAAGLGVVCADLDQDGWQDVYVANDAYANHLWINRHDGTLRDEAMTRGAALNLNGQPQAGMGVALGDLDGDARLDLFVTHLREETNALYLDRGAGHFSDATGASGVGPVSMPYTGFGVAALDFDLDRDLDLVVANGGVFHRPRLAATELGPPWDAYAEPNLFLVNAGQGRFEDGAARGGTLVTRVEISRGIAAGDLDGDGDPDLVMTQVNGPARIYRDDAPRAGRHWIALRGVHPGWRRDALGARLTLFACGAPQVRVLGSSWSYLASSPPVAYFGLGDCTAVERVEVVWPDGVAETFTGLEIDTAQVLLRGHGGS